MRHYHVGIQSTIDIRVYEENNKNISQINIQTICVFEEKESRFNCLQKDRVGLLCSSDSEQPEPKPEPEAKPETEPDYRYYLS